MYLQTTIIAPFTNTVEKVVIVNIVSKSNNFHGLQYIAYCHLSLTFIITQEHTLVSKMYGLCVFTW